MMQWEEINNKQRRFLVATWTTTKTKPKTIARGEKIKRHDGTQTGRLLQSANASKERMINRKERQKRKRDIVGRDGEGEINAGEQLGSETDEHKAQHNPARQQTADQGITIDANTCTNEISS
jgi:hypothetical protein